MVKNVRRIKVQRLFLLAGAVLVLVGVGSVALPLAVILAGLFLIGLGIEVTA